jgi:hypothetical protein
LATSDSREFLQFDDPACSTKAFIQSIIDGKPYSFYLSAVELAVLPRCFSHVELRGELGIFQIK